MNTVNVPLTFDQNDANKACQVFGCNLSDLANIGLNLALQAAQHNSGDLAVLDPTANWSGTKTILAELKVSDILAQIQGTSNNNGGSGAPTI